MFQNGFRLLTLIAWIAILFIPVNSSDIGCSTGSFRMGTKCYDPYFESTATFNNAQEICEENDGRIALFENEQISEFLINIGIKYKYQSYWVDSLIGGCSSLSFKNNYVPELKECNNNMFFACEFENVIDSTPNCSWHEDKCYKLIYVRVPARDVIARCSKSNGRMASVKTAGEREFFKKLLQEDKWWKNIHEEEIKKNHFSDFFTFWSGKRHYGKCGTRSYNSGDESGDCQAYHNFFCEYQAAPDIVPSTSTNPTTYSTTTESTSTIGSTTSTLETTSTLPSTNSTLESTSTLPSTTTAAAATSSSLEVTTSTNLVTSTWSSATTSLESSKSRNKESNADIETEKSDTTTVKEPTTTEKALDTMQIAIIGIMGALFIIITIVMVQLFKLRKKLFSKHYKENQKNQGPHSLPLLPSSPTSLMIQPTTDYYLTPNNTSIYSLPSDDTRDVNPMQISPWDASRNGPGFGLEHNILYGNSSPGLQNVSRSSQETIYTDHHYEEIQYNGVVIS